MSSPSTCPPPSWVQLDPTKKRYGLKCKLCKFDGDSIFFNYEETPDGSKKHKDICGFCEVPYFHWGWGLSLDARRQELTDDSADTSHPIGRLFMDPSDFNDQFPDLAKSKYSITLVKYADGSLMYQVYNLTYMDD